MNEKIRCGHCNDKGIVMGGLGDNIIWEDCVYCQIVPQLFEEKRQPLEKFIHEILIDAFFDRSDDGGPINISNSNQWKTTPKEIVQKIEGILVEYKDEVC